MSTFYRRNNEPDPLACIFFVLGWMVTGFYVWDLFGWSLPKIISALGPLLGTVVYFGIVAVVSLLIVSLIILAISAFSSWLDD